MNEPRPGRQLAAWAVVAVVATALLFGVLRWERRQAGTRWSPLLVGDARSGADLFATKGCASCHDAHRGSSLPASVAGPGALVTTMWNHAPLMWQRMKERSQIPAAISPTEMADVFAYLYIAQTAGAQGDPERGEGLFASGGCASCHAPRDLAAKASAGTPVAWTSGLWSHPAPPTARPSQKATAEAASGPPSLSRTQMSDVVAFLYGVRYAEPGGAPKAGELLYTQRSCDQCHGAEAQGTSSGPPLRGRGRRFSSIALAATLWRHGPAMYRQFQELGAPWPTLTEGEVGDLIAFLNTPPQPAR